MISDSSSTPVTGAISDCRAFIGSLFHHAISLVSLAGWEGREASSRYFRLILTVMGTLFFSLTGYLFLLTFFIMFLYRWTNVDWMWIALALAALHGVIALIGIWMFNRNIGKPLFAATFSEIRRDIETLSPPPGPLPKSSPPPPSNSHESSSYQTSSFSRY